jgi:tryptophan synthase alpha chain
VSRPGITGTHSGGRFDPELIGRLAGMGAPPPVFGFGISQPAHVRTALDAGARGVICGSAIIDAASRGGNVVNLMHLLKTATFYDKGRNDSGAQ